MVKLEEELNPIDRSMLDYSKGIMCGDSCGKCLHQCPQRGAAPGDRT